MRFGLSIPACIFVVASALPAAAAYAPPSTTEPPPAKEIRASVPRRLARASKFLSFRSIAAQVDNQVIANLLADSTVRPSDLALHAVAGEPARCETATCQVPISIRVDGALGPISLSLAVATPRGRLTDVQHVECSTGDCAISLILERGQNVVSVGVFDAVAQATGYATVRVNAAKTLADRGRSEWF